MAVGTSHNTWIWLSRVEKSFWGSETIAPATQKQGSHSPLNEGHIRPSTHFISLHSGANATQHGSGANATPVPDRPLSCSKRDAKKQIQWTSGHWAKACGKSNDPFDLEDLGVSFVGQSYGSGGTSLSRNPCLQNRSIKRSKIKVLHYFPYAPWC